MLKVGILTFHWAGNYGAVLQAFALQYFLKGHDIEVEDINYLPKRCIYMLRFFDVINHRFFKNISKSKVCKEFNKKYITSSKQSYYSNADLIKCVSAYDVFITGSDQVWNESFLMTAEKQPTLSYYLNFVPEEKKRISYAASFGVNNLTSDIVRYGIPELRAFDFISVREENAVELLREQGIQAKAVCDPVILLDTERYEEILTEASDKSIKIFDFILRNNLESSIFTVRYLLSGVFKGEKSLDNQILSVEEWLKGIKNCEIVVTDSFHCTIFAILFHKHFIAINDKNSGMNSRIKTLCSVLGLEKRILDSFDPERINQLIADQEYDWKSVDIKRKEWADASGKILLNALMGTES